MEFPGCSAGNWDGLSSARDGNVGEGAGRQVLVARKTLLNREVRPVLVAVKGLWLQIPTPSARKLGFSAEQVPVSAWWEFNEPRGPSISADAALRGAEVLGASVKCNRRSTARCTDERIPRFPPVFFSAPKGARADLSQSSTQGFSVSGEGVCVSATLELFWTLLSSGPWSVTILVHLCSQL